MTRKDEKLLTERKLVVVFDICSSTTILEDLKRTDNLVAWRNFLIGVKDSCHAAGDHLGMVVYKFIGDGWILFFPDDTPTDAICGFLEAVSMTFEGQFLVSILPLLTQHPSPIGLMFGIDGGDLVHVEMNELHEYLGRAINVASRLQSFTKELPGGPIYKALFSKNSFNRPAAPIPAVTVERQTVSLRNISPPTMECFVFQTFHPPPEKVVMRKRRSGSFPPRYRSGL
jgi:class 3 adenylate cyclase